MAVCKFYQQGNCRFGNNCRFEHPADTRNQQPRGHGGGSSGSNNKEQQGLQKYNINLETLTTDLTTERPLWILSSYAPGRGAPRQLFGGYPREQSFEELRLHYLTGKAAGREQEALNEAQQLYAEAEGQISTAVANVNQAAQYVLDGENEHPNRLDICTQGTQGKPFGLFGVGQRPALKDIVPSGGAQAQLTFGKPTGVVPGVFGAPVALTQTQRPNPFGSSNSAFGQPSQLGAATQSSPFGQPANSGGAFGQSSTLGAKPNPFGQQSQPAAQAGAFGQQSQLGQGGGFGQPSQLGQQTQPGAQGGGFGQPSQLGSRPNPFASAPSASPFGQPAPSNNAPSNPFGPNANANPSPFAQAGNNTPQPNPFGAPNPNNNTGSSPFAPAGNNPPQPNPFGGANTTQGAPAANPFGQPQQASSPFGQAQAPAPAPAPNPFGTANQPPVQNSNPFGQPQQASNPFGNLQPQPHTVFRAMNQTQSSPFGQPSNSGGPSNTTAGGPENNPYSPESGKEHGPTDLYMTKTMDGRLATFKGKPVVYRDDKPGTLEPDGTWKRIWFPAGAPLYYKDTQLPPEEYDEESKGVWMSFQETQEFPNGVMPELPPPREVTRWDF